MQRDTVQRRPLIQVHNGSPKRLRVAVVTESFLPTGNSVTTSVCRTLEHLSRRGHDAVVICPGPAPDSFAGAPVIGVPSISYRHSPIGLPSSKVMRTLASFAPDVVHLASPMVLGSVGVTAAGQLGVPSVAVFQSDATGFIRRHRAGLLHGAAWRWLRQVHEQADLTLATSAAGWAELRSHSVPRLALWQGGVDVERFSPRRRNTPAVAELRARLAPNGETLIGYLGTLTAQQQIERLGALAGLPNVRIVVAGTGPASQSLPPAGVIFLGSLDGDELANAYAALDLFLQLDDVPAGDDAAEEPLLAAMASGVPVVAADLGRRSELVAHGLNGLLYSPGDDAARRGAVASLAADRDQRRWMGQAARVGVERRTAEQLGDALIGHYRAVLRQRSVAA
ncbi:MAG TPA: glycosyltransferase [Kineosporiaceae bacterium]|nr:glycosyltransferase [Kineosporiaceae bacterium]